MHWTKLSMLNRLLELNDLTLINGYQKSLKYEIPIIQNIFLPTIRNTYYSNYIFILALLQFMYPKNFYVVENWGPKFFFQNFFPRNAFLGVLGR